jgi:hypothetical protein
MAPGIGEAVFTLCRFEPPEVEDRAVPSRTAPRAFPRQRRCKHGDDTTVLFMNPLPGNSDACTIEGFIRGAGMSKKAVVK